MRRSFLIELCLGTFDARDLRIADPAAVLAAAHQLHLEFYLLLRLGPLQGELGASSERWLSSLRQAVAMDTLANLRADRATLEVLGRLERAGVSAMVLKGSAMRARQPGLAGRFQGDVDLLVRKHELEAAARTLRASGFVFAGGHRDEAFYRDRHFHLPFEREAVRVELHWKVEPTTPEGFSQRLFELSHTLESAEGTIRVPALEHEILLGLIHLGRHAFFEGLRWLADISLTMPWTGPLRDRIESEARAWPRRAVALPLWGIARWGNRDMPFGADWIRASFLDGALLSRLLERHLLGESWLGLPAWVSHQIMFSWLDSRRSLSFFVIREALSAIARRLPRAERSRVRAATSNRFK